MNNFKDDRLPDSYAICLIGHGSRDPEGIQEFMTLWQKLRERKFCHTTEYGFWDLPNPLSPKLCPPAILMALSTLLYCQAFYCPVNIHKGISRMLSAKYSGIIRKSIFILPRPLGHNLKLWKSAENASRRQKIFPKNSFPRLRHCS